MLPRIPAALMLIAACLLCVDPGQLAQAQRADAPSEAAVKAAFLYRFPSYVEWPPRPPTRSGGVREFSIAVLGSSEVTRELQRLLPDRQIKNRRARVREIANPFELEQVDVLFVSAGYSEDLSRLIERMQDQSILIVTDHPHGLDAGSMINFMLVDQQVRFEISMTAVQRGRLKMAAELLSAAARVRRIAAATASPCPAATAANQTDCLAG